GRRLAAQVDGKWERAPGPGMPAILDRAQLDLRAAHATGPGLTGGIPMLEGLHGCCAASIPRRPGRHDVGNRWEGASERARPAVVRHDRIRRAVKVEDRYGARGPAFR